MSYLIQLLLGFLFRETIDGKNFDVSGLLPHSEDERDFRLQDLGGVFDYKPKHDVHEVPTLAAKNQSSLNTCVWNSYATCREVTEQVPLSPRSIVQFAAKNGYLRGNGFSSIREGQEAGRKFGIAEEKVLPNVLMDWRSYAGLDAGPIPAAIAENAASHRAESTFWVKTRNEVLRALDEGHAIHTGTDWYSSYNMSGGLRAPFILPWRRGVKVGGHAFALVGYDLRAGRQLLKFKNSFSEAYGDNGCFYVRMADWFREGIPGAVAIDFDDGLFAQFLRKYETHDVRTQDSPAIFRIEGGKKRAYPDENAFFAWGGRFGEEGERTFDFVASSVLDRVPSGEPMRAEDSPFWPKIAAEWERIRWMQPPDNASLIQMLIKR